jgi:hypothetical protein
MRIIVLSKPLFQLAEIIAAKRNEKAVRFGDMTYRSGSGYEAHLIGAKAEVGCAHLWNVPVDTSQTDRGDCGVDLYIGGRAVGIKATTYFENPLLRIEVEHWKKNCAYFCCSVDDMTIRAHGYVLGDDCVNREPRRLGKGLPLNYIFEPGELREFKNTPETQSIEEWLREYES